MLHPIYVGHFDHDALSVGKIKTIGLLDAEFIETELRRVGREEKGFFYIMQDRFTVDRGALC